MFFFVFLCFFVLFFARLRDFFCFFIGRVVSKTGNSRSGRERGKRPACTPRGARRAVPSSSGIQTPPGRYAYRTALRLGFAPS